MRLVGLNFLFDCQHNCIWFNFLIDNKSVGDHIEKLGMGYFWHENYV